MDRTDLQRLSKDELIELVIELQRPDKTSRNSSKPPSTDKKAKRENARPGGAKPGHEPHNRRLADNPDEIRDHKPTRCAQCGGAFSSDADMELIGEYDEIEIPPVKPHVVRHRRFACRCAHCGAGMKAPAPAVATTTPFGPRIHALAIYCKSFQALSSGVLTLPDEETVSGEHQPPAANRGLFDDNLAQLQSSKMPVRMPSTPSR